MNSYKAYEYAKSVDGDIRVPKYVQIQCREFCEIWEDKSDKYVIDFNLLKKIENLTKLMNMSSGFKVGISLNEALVGFQWLFIVAMLCVKHRDNIDKRRYEMATLLIARKNGKSFLIGAIFVLLLLLEPKYSESYSVASDGNLSRIVKKEIEQLLASSPKLQGKFKVRRDDIKCLLNENSYVPLNFSTGRMDGRKPNFFLCDEAGSLPTSYPIDSMKSGQINMLNRLGVIISTAYPTISNPMVDECNYAKKVLDGIIEDETYFALLYEPNEDIKKDWRDNDNVIFQANPLALEIDDNLDYLYKQRTDAINKPSSEVNFLTKHLNIFVNAKNGESLVDFNIWKKCEVDKIDFKGKRVTLGIDGSISVDLTGVCISYREGNNYYFKSLGILPRETIKDRREKYDYYHGERYGECLICEGLVIDQKALKEYILNIENEYGCIIEEIVFDQYNLVLLMNELSELYDCVSIRQTYSQLSAPTKEFQIAVAEGRVFYEKSKLLDIHMSDTLISRGKSGDIMITKETRKDNKTHIDLVSAMIFCMVRLVTKIPPIDLNKKILSDDFVM